MKRVSIILKNRPSRRNWQSQHREKPRQDTETHLHDETKIVKLYKAHDDGCDTCGHIGYKGRMGIYEVLANSPEIPETNCWLTPPVMRSRSKPLKKV